jgi:hemerythrin superfamily protein
MTATQSATSNKTSSRKTSSSRSTTKSTSKRSAASKNDAIKLLTADHKEVKALFKTYNKMAEKEASAEERQALAEQICAMLKVHTMIEEEIFYPAARANIHDVDLLDEAEVEHASAKDLISQIESMSPDEDLYDAKVKVLGEYIEHHVKEEEDELFPEVKKSDVDTAELGASMATRKQELMASMGLSAEA